MDHRHCVLVLVALCVVTTVCSCPTDCSCAGQRVQCYGQRLQHIPEGIPSDTTHLDLQSNEIETINPDRIKHLKNLQELLLGYNHIKKIESGTFSNLTNLVTLNMDSNMLTTLTPGTFDGLWNLTSLYITNNKLGTIDGAFRNLSKMARMDLGGNVIEELTDTTFEDLKNLLYLMLPDNKVKTISPNTFAPLQSLSYLVLKNNPIKNSNNLFKRNHRLSYIDLTQCSLKDVPSGLPWATRYLQLRSNNITRIKKNAFTGTRYLNIIVLDENQITRIDKGTFARARDLQELWLNDNMLKKVPSPFSAKVTKFHMSKNRLSKLSPKDFPSNSAITTLSLNSNMIATINPDTFKQVNYLKELYLSGNKITSLQQDMFANLRELETLSLNNNKLITIESGALNGLASLSKLEMAFIVDINTNVQGNLFAGTPNLELLDLQLSSSIAHQVLDSNDMMSSLVNVTTINLMNNELKTLNPNLQTYLSNVETVKIAGNRWHCDKRLQWLSAWLKSHKNLFFMSRNIQCYTPSSLKGLPLSILKPFQFAPVTTTPAPSTSAATTTIIPTSRSEATTTLVSKATKRSKSTRKPKSKTKPSPTMQYPSTKIMLTKTKLVTVTQRFFVYASTTVSPLSTKSHTVTKKIRKKLKSTPQSKVHPTASKSIQYSKVTKSSQTTRPTQVPKTKHITYSFLAGQSSTATLDTSTMTTSLEALNPNQNSTKATNDKVSNTTSGKQSWYPGTTNSSDTNSELSRQATVTSSSGVNMTTVIIATCVSAAVLLIILCVVIFFAVRYRQNKLVYHRALQYRQDYSDVVFFVGEPIQDFVDPKQKAARSRSDRGSTSSRPSEDITNDLDTSMKVYTWDDE